MFNIPVEKFGKLYNIFKPKLSLFVYNKQDIDIEDHIDKIDSSILCINLDKSLEQNKKFVLRAKSNVPVILITENYIENIEAITNIEGECATFVFINTKNHKEIMKIYQMYNKILNNIGTVILN